MVCTFAVTKFSSSRAPPSPIAFDEEEWSCLWQHHPFCELLYLLRVSPWLHPTAFEKTQHPPYDADSLSMLALCLFVQFLFTWYFWLRNKLVEIACKGTRAQPAGNVFPFTCCYLRSRSAMTVVSMVDTSSAIKKHILLWPKQCLNMTMSPMNIISLSLHSLWNTN
jgi:hypothetical protein